MLYEENSRLVINIWLAAEEFGRLWLEIEKCKLQISISTNRQSKSPDSTAAMAARQEAFRQFTICIFQFAIFNVTQAISLASSVTPE